MVFFVLPLRICYILGSWLGLLSGKILSKRRHAVERNLLTAFGDQLSPEELKQLSKDVFRRNGGNLFASIKTATMSLDAVKKCLIIEGADQLQQFVKENDGAIIILPHMGNWEVGVRLNEIVYGDLSSGGMYRPLNNPYLDSLMKKRRQLSGSKLFARNDGMAAPLQLIRDPGVLGILADQRVGKAGQLTPFFGRLTSFSPLPQIYKRRTKCALISLAIITEAPGKWRIKYTLEADKSSEINTGDVAHIIEKLMRLSPADCFWVQDRWKLETKPLFLAGKSPIIQPLLANSSFKKQQLGIYIDEIDPEQEPALKTLAEHRPDIELTIYSPNPNEYSSDTLNIVQCPTRNDSEAVVKFFVERHNSIFTFLLLVPSKATFAPLEELHTSIHQLDYQNLAQSLHDAGLPLQPIE